MGAATVDLNVFPRPYCSNTSSNSIVRELVEWADFETCTEIEHLIEGGRIDNACGQEETECNGVTIFNAGRSKNNV